MPTQTPSLEQQITAKRAQLLAVRRTLTEQRIEAFKVQQEKIATEQRILDQMQRQLHEDVKTQEDALAAEIKSLETNLVNTRFN